jgi:TetR/AcrR family transcriptional regulator, cholesterol catabolism regulator
MASRTQHILEQARKLYVRYGIKSVTMDDVAQHLCISKKTLYEHFKDKEDLVRSILVHDSSIHHKIHHEIFSKNLNAVEELLEVYRMIHKRFRDYNPSMEYDIRKYYPDLYLSIREIRRNNMLKYFTENMEKGKQEGLYRKTLDVMIIAKLQVFRFENLFDNDLLSLQEVINLKVFHELFIYHMHGILSDKGLAFFKRNFKKLTASLV